MSRTTPAAVQAILGDNYDFITDLQQFCDTANVVINRVVPCAADRDIILSSVEQEMMERWLAAHYYAQMDLLYQTKTTSEASANFQGQTTMSIESTRYGQSAINMDWSGCLSALSKRQFARGFWMGSVRGTGVVWCGWRGGWW